METHAEPLAWFSWHYVVLEGDRPIAKIEPSPLGRRVVLEVGERRYEMRRRVGFGRFELWDGGEIVAWARRESLFRRAYVVTYEGGALTLASSSWLGRAFELREGGATIGSIALGRFPTRRARVDLPERLPAHVRALLVALAVLQWRAMARSG